MFDSTALKSAPKIVFVNRYFDPDQSATSQLLTDLTRGLAAAGLELHVVCSRQKYDAPEAFLAAEEQLAGVHVHRVATTRFGRRHLPGRALDYATFYFASAVMLLRLLGRGDILVVKTDPPLLSIMAVPLAKAKHGALITWQQDVFPEIASHLGANPLPRYLTALLQRMRDASLCAAVINIVIGERMREYFSARGVPETKLRIISNWADGEAIQPKAAANSGLRSQLGLLDRFVVGYSGNMGRAHEFDTLLGAAEELREHVRFVFLMIGGGAKMESLKKSVSARGLTNFRFLPYQARSELQDSLAAADVHLVSLLPALEGLIVPSKLYGILAAGRPLIFMGDSDGDVARVIDDARCGVYVPVGDSRALADSLQELAADPDARTSMGQRARAVFCARFSRSQAIEQWCSVLDAVLKGGLMHTHTSPVLKTDKL